MKTVHLVAIGAVSVVLLAAWTQNTQSDWLKGIIYAGSGKVQITNAAGQLSTTGPISASGNVAIGGTLAVSGATTLAGNLSEQGNASVAGTLAVTSAATLSSTLAVTGAATLSSTLAVSGAATFSLPPLFASAETALTAHAGGTQAAALALSATKFMHVVSTVGTAADSVALPAPVLGTCHLVVNEAAANALQLFAITPATVNGKATATGVSLSAAKGALCCAASSTDYACTGPN